MKAVIGFVGRSTHVTVGQNAGVSEVVGCAVPLLKYSGFTLRGSLIVWNAGI